MGKRDYGKGTLFQRNGRWIFREPGSKKQHSLIDPDTGLRPAGKTHARRLADELLIRLRTKGEDVREVYALKELDALYQEAFPHSLTDRGWEDRERAIRFFCEAFPTVRDITHEGLGKWVSERLRTPIRQGRRDAGRETLSPASVNRELAALKRLCRWAFETGRIGHDPCQGFPYLEEDGHRERVLSEEEIDRLLAAADLPRFRGIRSIVRLALFCGMRQGEIFNLRWGDLDEENQVIDLLRTKAKDRAARTRRRRKIPIPSAIWEELTSRERVGEWVFPGRVAGRPRGDMQKAWLNLLEAAGIEGCTFHDLRHTALTRLAKHVDFKTLMEIAGHSNPRTTMRYVNPSLEDKRAGMEKVFRS